MAFMEGFKKFMGMSPLDEGIDDDDDDVSNITEVGNHGFGYGGNLDNLDNLDKLGSLDELDGYDSGVNYNQQESSGAFSREETNNVVNIHQASGNQPQVVLVKPDRFEDASGIADHMHAKRTVVINTDSVSQDVRRRLIDFLSGVAFAEGGTIKKASNTTFVITPNTVGVMGESVAEESEQDTNGGTYY